MHANKKLYNSEKNIVKRIMNTETIDLVQQYKYLSILLDEHFKFEVCDDIFTKSGRRALASLISKYNKNKNEKS